MTLGKRLKELREGRGYTQRDLAETLNIGNSTLAMYEIDKREPDNATLIRLAEFFGVTTDNLLGRDKPAAIAASTPVPLLGPIRAGVPLISDDNYTETVTPPKGVRADFASPVEGDSMIFAGIHPGDIAFFREAGQAHTGQIVAARLIDTDALVNLKFYIQKNGQAVLRSANPEYPDIPFTENHAVVGVMTGLIRDGSPVLNDYERLLITTESINAKWTSAVNQAIGDGISPEQFISLVSMMKSFLKGGQP